MSAERHFSLMICVCFRYILRLCKSHGWNALHAGRSLPPCFSKPVQSLSMGAESVDLGAALRRSAARCKSSPGYKSRLRFASCGVLRTFAFGQPDSRQVLRVIRSNVFLEQLLTICRCWCLRCRSGGAVQREAGRPRNFVSKAQPALPPQR